MKSFGEKLVEEREKQNISQKRLAEMLNITPTRLNYWEKDKRQPNIEMIKKISTILNISTDVLLSYSNSNIKTNNIWSELDKQYPNIGEDVKRYEALLKYVEDLGFTIKFDVTKWHWEDIDEPPFRMQVEDEIEYVLIKDDKKATFTSEEFDELQNSAQDAIEGRFYKKVVEQSQEQK